MRGHVRRRCTCGKTLKAGRRCPRCGRDRSAWEFIVTVGRREDGQPQQRSRAGFATRREAEASLREVLRKLDGGGDPFAEKAIFRDYARGWLAQRRADGLRATTVHRYALFLRDDIEPALGHLELRKVRPGHLRDVLNGMSARGLAPATVTQAHAVVGGIFKQAVLDGLIEVSPATAVRRPKQERARKVVPRAEQVGAFVRGLDGEPWELPMTLAAVLGTRRSETLAIAWSDLDRGSVAIARGLQWVRTDSGERVLRFLPLKSERAYRTLTLPVSVVGRLRRARKEQAERRIALGPEWRTVSDHDGAPLDLVCERGDGRPLDPDAMTKAFKRLAARAGLDPRSSLHDLRHAFVTTLARRGVHPRIASGLAGHSDPGFTLRVYTDAWEEGAQEAATALGDALGLDDR